jgi:hypothetical protein
MSYSTGLRLATKAVIAQTVPPANYTGAASTDVYVSTRNGPHVTFIIQTGAWAGGTAAVTLLQATTVGAGSAKALAFDTMYTNATDTTTSLLVSTAVVSNTFNLSVANATYVVEVDASSLDAANNFDCVTLHVATPGSNNDYYGVVAVLAPDRYIGTNPPNVLVD